MDGLLIDSEPLWQEAETLVFSKVGIALTPEKMIKTMGLRVDEVVQYWYSRQPWEGVTQEQVKADIVNNVISLIRLKGKAMPGVQNTITLFKKRNLPMAIASSSLTEIINAVLEKIDIRKDLKTIYSAEHESYGKPHPGVYITTAEKLGVAPEHCLAIEDSPNGVLSAKAARMKCIAIPDHHSSSDPRIQIADLVVSSLEALSEKDLLLLDSKS